MKRNLWIFILVALVASLVVSGCQKSASKNPVATQDKTAKTVFPTPIPNDSVKNAQAGTQTAQALEQANQPTNTPKPQQDATATEVPPTPTVKVVIPTATPGRPAEYVLQKGEFPYCIARRFNINVGDLLSLNGLNINSKPAVGYKLKIPQSGTWNTGDRALKAHPTTYAVKAGDTIYSVACQFGDVDPNDIIAANTLKSPYTLTAGQSLSIP